MSDAGQPAPGHFRYQPFYCEENAWWLCAEPALAPSPGTARGGAQVLFIVNRAGHCPFAGQRAGARGEIIWWDYHVVLLDAARRIWDLDTRLGLPLPAADWLTGSFPFIARLPAALAPRFRLVPCAEYRRDFASDRSHMRDSAGRWRHPPPPWPAIGRGMRLPRYLHPDAPEPGQLLDYQGLLRLLSGR